MPLLFVRPDLCLDFANTRYWRGTEPPTDELQGFGDVLAWITARGISETDDAVRPWRERPAEAGTTAFAAALDLREALYGIFSAAALGTPPVEADIETLNQALADTPARTRLRHTPGGYAWEVTELKPTVANLLAPVLWSAGDLLGSARLARVRRCANEKCLYLFADDSRNGTRRWCSMSTCGNRAKAHRHYDRTRRKA
jgi:predicted RNA-binding Zn ribbon-like protein